MVENKIGLSIEVCFKEASVSLILRDGIKTITEKREHKQSDSLAKMCQKLMITNKVHPMDLDFVISNKGPGSFTGVRIGLSFMEGLTFALPKAEKFYLSSFDIALADLDLRSVKRDFLVIIQAIRDTFYIQRFSIDIRPFGEPEYLSLQDLQALINGNTFHLIGNFAGFDITGDVIKDNILINSESIYKVKEKFPHLVSNLKTPLYIRNALITENRTLPTATQTPNDGF